MAGGHVRQAPYGGPTFVEVQAVHIVGAIGERDLCLGTRDIDGPDVARHLVFLAGEHMRARTVDLAALARAVRAGIGLPVDFLRWTRLTRPVDFSEASLDWLR